MSDRTKELDTCKERFRELYGLPPYDGPDNVLKGDSYYAYTIRAAHPKDICDEARDIVIKELEHWRTMRGEATPTARDTN